MFLFSEIKVYEECYKLWIIIMDLGIYVQSGYIYF